MVLWNAKPLLPASAVAFAMPMIIGIIFLMSPPDAVICESALVISLKLKLVSSEYHISLFR